MSIPKCVSAHECKPVWEHSSLVLEMLNSLDGEQPKQITAPSDPAYTAQVTEALTEFQSELKEALKDCEAEIARLSVSGTEGQSALSSNYAFSAGRSVVRLEKLLYTYTDTARFNRFAVWQYINTHKQTNSEKVDIQISDDLVLFRIPYLTRRNYGNNAVVNDMLAAKIFKHQEFPNWQRWTATFHHVYPTNTKTIPRDVDNYDYKKTIDLIAYALGASDNALCYDMSMRTVFTDELTRGVYIEVRPKSSENEELPPWQTKRSNRAKTAEKTK